MPTQQTPAQQTNTSTTDEHWHIRRTPAHQMNAGTMDEQQMKASMTNEYQHDEHPHERQHNECPCTICQHNRSHERPCDERQHDGHPASMNFFVITANIVHSLSARCQPFFCIVVFIVDRCIVAYLCTSYTIVYNIVCETCVVQ